MTASNPFARIVAAVSELASAAAKLGESVAERATGKEREAIQSELRQAQAVGQFTVLMATAKAKAAISDLLPKATVESVDATPAPREDEQTTTEIGVDRLSPPTSIPDYDSLTASQVVAQLGELTAEERSEILAYEQANRARNSILKEISRLA